MRTVWLDRGKVMKPYTIADLQSDLAKVTKNPKFAADFYKNYVYGIDKMDYAALLAKAGMVMRRVQPGKAWIGQIGGFGGRNRAGQVRAAATAEGFTIPSNTIIGTPLYKAGLDVADVILTADGKDIKDAEALNEIVATKKPGDKIAITYKNRSGQHETVITPEESPMYEILTFETAGQTPSADQLAFRNNWLSSKAK